MSGIFLTYHAFFVLTILLALSSTNLNPHQRWPITKDDRPDIILYSRALKREVRLKMIRTFSGAKRLGKFLSGLFALFLMLALSAYSFGNPVQIYDGARVLNAPQVQNAASRLSHPVAIYSTNTFQGTQTDFQRTATQKLNGNPNLIVMAIDTAHHYIFIAHGPSVPLSSPGVRQAVSAFSANYGNGDYTSASLAALSSLQNSLSGSYATNTTRPQVNTNRGAGFVFSPVWLCCAIPVLLILAGILFGVARRGQGRSMLSGPGRGGPAPYRPDMPPDYNPANQGPYYGQPYGQPQRGGMNPWAAGGLGAAAGGLAGYELGRMQGERQGEQDMGYGDPGQFGAGGDFGGDMGAGGNFGGDQGAGGDFGSGGSFGGDFGGDQGAGGSFGGDDFGSGGSFGGDDSGSGGNF